VLLIGACGSPRQHNVHECFTVSSLGKGLGPQVKLGLWYHSIRRYHIEIGCVKHNAGAVFVIRGYPTVGKMLSRGKAP
jgi:hypothetical protein